MTLDEHQRQFECFDKYAIQVEGWLKGEIVHVFDSEVNAKKLDYFAPEADYPFPGRKKVDCKLILNGTPVWIELKHFQVGWQDEERWKASDYFVDKKYGIYNDVDKLSKIDNGGKYILILATKNPRCDELGNWEKGINKFNEKFAPLRIRSHTMPSDFPDSYFLGLLEVV
jgi:hypothetical protein